MRINVYLPKGYEENNNPLPVLYFLHGRSGNENIIFDLNMKGIADEMIESGKIKPLIINTMQHEKIFSLQKKIHI